MEIIQLANINYIFKRNIVYLYCIENILSARRIVNVRDTLYHADDNL